MANINTVRELTDYIAELINGTRFEGHVYAVGSLTRNIALGGTEVKDLDLVIDLEHGGVGFATWLACKTGCHKAKSNPVIFPNYGTAKINLKNNPQFKDIDIECVSSCKEYGFTQSKTMPTIVSGNIKEDGQLRDLTINAIYLNLSTGEVIDSSGKGFSDVEKEIIRTANDPDKVYSKDPLRLLRTIRFATTLGWGIEKNTWIGLVQNAYRIDAIAQERITEEFNKILLADKPSRGIRALYNSGILEYFLPEIYNLVGCEQGPQHFGDVFEHTMMVLDNSQPKLENRLAALLHDVGKPKALSTYNYVIHFTSHEDIGATMVSNILQRMKYSNEIISTVKIVVKNHMRFKAFADGIVPSNRLLRRFSSTVGDKLDIALDVINADNISHSEGYNKPKQIPAIIEKYKELEAKGEKVEKIKLPINGNDIMETLKIKRSPNIGKYLNVVKEAYLDNPKITKEECLKLVKEAVLTE